MITKNLNNEKMSEKEKIEKEIALLEKAYKNKGISVNDYSSFVYALHQRLKKEKMKEKTENTITVKIKNVYGQERIYPICQQAKTFIELTGKLTFDKFDIEKIKSLGFEIKVQTQTL